MRPTRTERVAELARTIICEHLLAHGYQRGVDPIWLARLLVARLTFADLLERLQRR
ncbi:MAG TPA: hypothetical protein VFJ70_15445 [Burkholderiales bacterium]|nr:hypothetical protein [Burkholderiales bacterium]